VRFNINNMNIIQKATKLQQEIERKNKTDRDNQSCEQNSRDIFLSEAFTEIVSILTCLKTDARFKLEIQKKCRKCKILLHNKPLFDISVSNETRAPSINADGCFNEDDTYSYYIKFDIYCYKNRSSLNYCSEDYTSYSEYNYNYKKNIEKIDSQIANIISKYI